MKKQNKEVTQLRFKAVLLLFLVFFAAIGTIALVNLSARAIIPKNLKTAAFALGLGIVQPAGGDPVDNPHPH
jgi:amino acid permease